MTRKTRGFTLIELLVVIAIIALLIGLLLPALAKAQSNARSLKDKSQVRQIQQGMVIHAGDNRDKYPTPGLVNRLAWDPSGGTGGGLQQVPGAGPEDSSQNSTDHMFSLMVAQGLIPPELCVGVTESNQNIVPRNKYDFDSYNPGDDMYWDNEFKAELEDEGHCSYSHLAICGERKKRRWVNMQDGRDPLIGNRAPEFGTSNNVGSVMSTPEYAASNTLELHGSDKSWMGHVAMGDGSCTTIETPYHSLVNYEAMNSFQVENDILYAKEFADATSATDPNEGSGDAWLSFSNNADAGGDEIDEIHD
jgi:prepilin-type N-terminal cleavage/methylation domain-containing protein